MLANNINNAVIVIVERILYCYGNVYFYYISTENLEDSLF